MCVQMHMCIYISVYGSIRIHVLVYVPSWRHVHTYTDAQVCTYVGVLYLKVCACVCSDVHICA